MTSKTKRLRIGLLAALAIVGGGAFVGTASAQVPPEQTGATATKECPNAPISDPYTVGDTVECTATFINAGAFPATITSLTEQAPFFGFTSPNNGPFEDIECTIPGSTTPLGEGDILQPGVVCTAAIEVTIPTDPAFCNTLFRDRVAVEFLYHTTPGLLTSDAGATHTLAVVCPPTITVDKTADALGKVTDPVAYSITVCNTGLVTVTKTSVVDSLIPGVNAAFGATLAPGVCEMETFSRTVVAGDPDPLVNTVTAIYTVGAQTTQVTDSASTNLFVPSVDVIKSCGPNPNEVGGTETCLITVTNGSTSDAPALVNGTIVDTLTGDLLVAGNSAVTASNCTATLAVGASCQITTQRVIQASDPNPVVNTVTVHYNPDGFTNDVTDSASASVATAPPAITVTKTASPLSKIGDDVDYSIEICNAGLFPVNRTSVNDTLAGDIAASFAATLAPGACTDAQYSRTVAAADPDPLVNTVTAVYSGAGASATATATASTNLFVPGVDVTKNCAPDPISVGQVEACTIVVTNTSTSDAPALTNGTIVDTLSGDLLAAGNTAVASSTCTTGLATGASCTIVTNRTVLASDVSPIVNTVTVHYNPHGFPNDITDSATDSVTIQAGGEGCTPGYWKQPQHSDSWVGYSPTDRFNTVFDVTITLNATGNTPAISNPTLLQALEADGGGINALARHAVAALLNSSNTGVDSDFTTAEVIALVQDAVTPGGLSMAQVQALLAAANEQGCPLN